MWNELPAGRTDAFLADVLGRGHSACFPELTGGAEAFLAWGAARALKRPILWVCDGARTLQSAHRDLRTLAPPDASLLYYPPWETAPGGAADPQITGDRLATLDALARPSGPRLIATCIQALIQKTLGPALAREHVIRLAPGAEADLAQLVRRIEQSGYAIVPEVQAPAQAAVRGGILDVWPTTEEWPLRLDFFGETLDSVRAFDPLDQRSRDRLDHALLTPAGEVAILRRDPSSGSSLLDHLPPDTAFIWSRDEAIREHAAIYESSVTEARAWDFATSSLTLREQIDRRPGAIQFHVGSDPGDARPYVDLDFAPIEAPSASPSDALQPDLLEQARRDALARLVDGGRAVFAFFDTPGSLDRFIQSHPDARTLDRIRTAIGPLSEGFVSDVLGLAVVAESDLYGRRKAAQGRYDPHGRRGAAPSPGAARISDWSDIEPGDLVVHVEHGIGRYLGLRSIVFDGQMQEVLAIEYAEQAKLYVPVSQAHLLTRYVGVGKRLAHWHKLGGRQWSREKEAAEHAVRDFASGLLETHAARNALPGHAFPPDSTWQHQFEAAFPFRETRDQERAITEVKADMENTRPMDRLVCGDAGYGKTEVAMRAAFKAVMGTRQVAVLVPTTILAQQHYYTFSERMAAFPVRVEMLSRFRTGSEQDAVLRGVRDGSVDIVIGTHALLQPGVEFRDLGLVIIDEEQKFGVLHKERFKHIRRLVDVLTLTATPIPRTLYLSLTGAKELSTIQTPPQDRLAIETVVSPATDEVVREAILREINREGQVYYLYNRVLTIDRVRERLRRVVPEARVIVAHGQMPAGELAEVMQAFVKGEYDVLLCTTIIESGVDIPNANTILIDRADRFGMAELYQLRGRVGRARKKAYAYMLLPVHVHVDPTARKRIQAIKQYANHGAGFRLAMRDLEIRGAGNLLGSEQSGHIAAVGFALYCQLLKRTVARMQGEPVPPVIDVTVRLDFIDLSPEAAGRDGAAVLPVDYVEDERLRILLYRKIAEAAVPEDVDRLSDEFRDRFGAPPPALARLLRITTLRITAAHKGITSIEVQEDRIMLMGPAGYLMHAGRFPRLKAEDPDARIEELIEHVRTRRTAG